MAATADQFPKRSNNMLEKISSRKHAPVAGFVFLIALFVATYVLINITSHAEGVVFIFGSPTSIRTLTGVFSSIANVSLMFLVLFYDRPGFFTALGILIVEYPILLIDMISSGSFANLPGLFSNTFIILAAIIIYKNNERIKKYQKRILDQAVTDRLTNLPNRFARSEVMDGLVKKNRPFAVACFNLNNFKSINNTMGAKVGNKILIEVGNRLRDAAESASSGTDDFVTYQGADEFAIIVRSYRTDEDVLRTIEHYEQALEKVITIDDCDYFLTASVGYALYPDDAETSDTVLSHADTAMHNVKGANTVDKIRRFSPEMLSIEKEVEIERKLRAALDEDTLYFNLQPQYDMSHKLIGFEALARMKDAEGNMISPGEFIPVAEKAGLVDEVDLTVFRKSASFFGELLRETGINITLSVNVSVKHLMKNDFIEEIRQVLATSGIPTSNLEFEITESIMIDSADKALQCIRDIKNMGIKIAIDDFGTGYSSLSYLNSFPADLLKVDKAFIDKMNSSESSKQYVAAIITLGHIMNFAVISEGVEQHDQLETLRSIGCDYVQGFIWGRPLEPEDAAYLMREQVKA